MTDWSLTKLLAGLHDEIEQKLNRARESFAHAPTKGDASQDIWIQLFNDYLPQRYKADSAHIVDSEGNVSQQIDVVIFDRQYTPPILHFSNQKVIPAESVYAVFEAKQTLNDAHLKYAQEKAASVRVLQRTSLPIPHAGGQYQAKKLTPILAGILTLESEWSPPLGNTLHKKLEAQTGHEILDIGCVASHGLFFKNDAGVHTVYSQSKAATAFILELIAQLQALGTVAMIDTRAYAKWLR